MPRPWKTPDLPQGPLHAFNRGLHALHRKAGYPSARAIQEAVGGERVVSHTTIHHAFTKPARPSWGVVELVVEELAKRARPRIDPEAEVDRFKALWDAVEGDGSGDEPPVEPASPHGVGSSDPPSSAVLPEVQELIVELRRIKDRRGMTLEALARRTGYSRSSWNRALRGRGEAFPPREAVLRLGDRRVDTDRLAALWDRADRARKASMESWMGNAASH
jgi:hypothetical protein